MVDSVRNLDIVWLIGVMCVVQTLAQVCPYSDPKCSCYSNIITCYSLQQIPTVIIGISVNQIPALRFQKGNITTISNNSIPPGLTSIELLNNPFTNISDEAFDASAATLQNLDIRDAKFKSLPTALKKLTKMTHLHIENTKIEDWDAATLKQIAATLEILELINVGLFSWPNWISDFHLLHSIDFDFNFLKSVPDDAFGSIKHSLTSLDLASTGLTHIPQALSMLSDLESLFLSFNNISKASEIEKITTSPFAPKLTYLFLHSVGLSSTANFSNLTSLRLLDLDDNRISDIPAGSLPASLTELDLRDNSLSSVPHDVANMPGLSSLNLPHNVVTWIEPNTFPSSLTFLDLSFNNLTIITNTIFENLYLLGDLRLDYNPISTISPEAFSDLTSLQTLTIDGTRVTEIPLGFALLDSEIELYFSTTQPLSCPCPAPQKLVQWFASLTHDLIKYLICSNGQLIQSYLSDQCGQPTATP